jgi:hypothetical protein
VAGVQLLQQYSADRERPANRCRLDRKLRARPPSTTTSATPSTSQSPTPPHPKPPPRGSLPRHSPHPPDILTCLLHHRPPLKTNDLCASQVCRVLCFATIAWAPPATLFLLSASPPRSSRSACSSRCPELPPTPLNKGQWETRSRFRPLFLSPHMANYLFCAAFYGE